MRLPFIFAFRFSSTLCKQAERSYRHHRPGLLLPTQVFDIGVAGERSTSIRKWSSATSNSTSFTSFAATRTLCLPLPYSCSGYGHLCRCQNILLCSYLAEVYNELWH